MKLDWAILSNSAEVAPNNLAYVLGGGWDTAWRSQFPAAFGGALTLRLLLNRLEVARPHQLEVHLLDEDGHPFVPPVTRNMSEMNLPPDYPKGWDVPALLAIGMPVLPIPSPGHYSLEILIDGQHVKSVPFRFILGPPPPPPQLPRKPE